VFCAAADFYLHDHPWNLPNHLRRTQADRAESGACPVRISSYITADKPFKKDSGSPATVLSLLDLVWSARALMTRLFSDSFNRR
jgi:hypothetical protein